MQKGEILQEGALIEDILKVSLKHFIYLVTMFFTTFSIHVDYIFSLYDFTFSRETRDSFQVYPGSKSLKIHLMELILVLKHRTPWQILFKDFIFEINDRTINLINNFLCKYFLLPVSEGECLLFSHLKIQHNNISN